MKHIVTRLPTPDGLSLMLLTPAAPPLRIEGITIHDRRDIPNSDWCAAPYKPLNAFQLRVYRLAVTYLAQSPDADLTKLPPV